MKFSKLSMLTVLIVLAIVMSSLVAFAEGNATSGKLNVNSATVEQLAAVPGLTPELAQKIVDYRNEMGDITNIDELKDVDGISPDILEQIKGHIGVEGIEGSDCTC
jgi:competence protein ComEA